MTEPTRAPRRSSSARFLRDLVVIVVVAVLASFLIKTFLVRSFYIPSASMETTLLGDPGHHDRILVDELVPRLVPLRRGDVVVFTDPGGWLTGDEPQVPPPTGPVATLADGVLSLIGFSSRDANDHLVKRVIGLPGDHVECCDARGRTSVNGVALDEPYARISAHRVPFDITVHRGDVWVMGDNRDESADSRYHQHTATGGGVPITDVVGRAFVVSWPISRWKYLGDYPATFARIPAAPAPAR